MNSLSELSRRFVAEGASGIGSWLNIMEFMSFICIPINIAIIYFAADGPGLPSTIVTNLREKSDFWTDKNIILFVVGLEHVILVLKAFIAVVIPDVPAKVISDEFKRDKEQELSQHGLLMHKIDGKHKAFNDVVADLQNEAVQEMEETLAAQNDAINNSGLSKKAKKKPSSYNYEEKFMAL